MKALKDAHSSVNDISVIVYVERQVGQQGDDLIRWNVYRYATAGRAYGRPIWTHRELPNALCTYLERLKAHGKSKSAFHTGDWRQRHPGATDIVPRCSYSSRTTLSMPQAHASNSCLLSPSRVKFIQIGLTRDRVNLYPAAAASASSSDPALSPSVAPTCTYFRHPLHH